MEVELQRVSFPSKNPVGDCVGVILDGKKRADRGLIVLHAWWGLTDEIQSIGRHLADKTGYVILIPDLYRGKRTDDRREASHYMDDLDWHGAVTDIDASVLHLKSRDCQKVAATGFCMGGALCLLSAALHSDLGAVVPFYGIPKPQLGDLTQIKIPIQGHFGEDDKISGFSSPEDYLALDEKLKAAGVRFELHVYKGMDHAFANPDSPNYNKVAADLAFSRLHDFIERELR